MSDLRTQAFKYTMLPGFIPRITSLFASGFTHISYLIAVVYSAVRLLPADHPYLNPANRGLFGIRHVIAEAANNLQLNKKNLDQIIIFFTVLAGIVLLFGQAGLLIIAIIAEQPAIAQTGLDIDLEKISLTFTNIFLEESLLGHGGKSVIQYNASGDALASVRSASQDIVFILMDRIWGLDGIFNSCVSTDDPCLDLMGRAQPSYGEYPTNFHMALRNMIAFYSYGLFMIAVFLIAYFITTLVAETATSGTPFGQRANKLWAPVRLILFFAMLIPITGKDYANGGFNGAQILTFWTAKVASNFATNSWGYFATSILREDGGQLLGKPEYPELNELVRFLFVAKTCQFVEQKAMTEDTLVPIEAYLVRPKRKESEEQNWTELSKTDFEKLYGDDGFLINGDTLDNIIISFGYVNEKEVDGEMVPISDKQYLGNVIPVCGKLTIPYNNSSQAYNRIAQEQYNMIHKIWTQPVMNPYAHCLSEYGFNRDNDVACTELVEDGYNPDPDEEADFTTASRAPDREFVHAMITSFNESFHSSLDLAMIDIENEGMLTILDSVAKENTPDDDRSVMGRPATILSKGWGGGGLLYNRIAEINGDFADAIYALPRQVQLPMVMESVAKHKQAVEESVGGSDVYNPVLSSGAEVRYDRPEIDTYIAPVLYRAYHLFELADFDETPRTQKTGNVFIDAINAIFGTQGIFDMYENVDIHPLAQLSSLGKSMMHASVRNIAGGFALEGISTLFEKLKMPGPEATKAVGGFFKTVGFSVLALSIVLYYVLPFLPFIYFMFAVSGWIKSIFEAIVAMPLWAMAHIRIDGDGLPGTDASNGYYLLLEIFLRPILITFGLVASIALFSAMVQGLNEVFDTILLNIAGFSTDGVNPDINITYNGEKIDADNLSSQLRGPVDKFFYTVMYVIIVYMMGLSSFKLVDAIPNQIMRWMGVSVSTFQEGAGDPAGELSGKTFQGTTLLTQRLSGGQVAALLEGVG